MVKGIPSIVVPCSEPSSPNDSDDTQDGGGEVGAWGWGWGGRSENKDEVEDRREDLWQDTAPPPDMPSSLIGLGHMLFAFPSLIGGR